MAKSKNWTAPGVLSPLGDSPSSHMCLLWCTPDVSLLFRFACEGFTRSRFASIALLVFALNPIIACQPSGGERDAPNAAIEITTNTGDPVAPTAPFIVVLGVGQDGGVPQAGRVFDRRWKSSDKRHLVASIGIVDPATRTYWLLDATPDLPEQLTAVAGSVPGDTLSIGGVFLTHAHIGHYTGLMYFGHEAMGANSIPTFAMPKMKGFLETNGPWDQLVRYNNIELRVLEDGRPVQLSQALTVTPLVVPHRQEYSEVVGYKVSGPEKSILFIPDIDSWRDLDAAGSRIEDWISDVDYAFLDGTFFENGELPGRDMSGFPHPFIRTSIERFAGLPASERAKVYFIHLNHSNAALDAASDQSSAVRGSGMQVAEEGMRFGL